MDLEHRSVRRSVFATGFAVVLLAAWSTTAHANDEDASPIDATLARIEVALSAYPDDPDLEWAYATTLATSGQPERAAQRMARYAARWPARRDDVDLTYGRILFDAGRAEEARERLVAAIGAHPSSGIARFYHALALRELGQRQEARAELIRTGRLTPALRGEATLLLSIDAFSAGDEEEGVRHAQDVIRFDPTSDAAARARMLLREKDLAATRRPWRADGYVGIEYDDNVRLTSNRDDSRASDRDDIKGVWGAGLAWRQMVTDKMQWLAGYRFDQALYGDLSDYDYLNNALHFGGLVKLHSSVALRLDTIGWNTRQDGEHYLWAGTARPSVLLALPNDWGLVRVFANAEYRDFDATPIDRALEQEGWTFGTGVEWNIAVPLIGGTTSLSAAFNETQTEAHTTESALGDFEGDYDLRSLRIHHRLRVPLPFDFEAGSDISYTRGWYLNNNFGGFLADFLVLPGDQVEVRKRRDHYVGGRIFLARPLHRYVRAAIEYKPSRRFSNVDLYDYERHAVGFVIRVQSD